MKKLVVLLLLSPCIHSISANAGSSNAVQEIRYLSVGATQVYLVWGINNWNMPPDSLQPSGSFIKDKLVYTPMQQSADGFSIELNVPRAVMIDYVFWITGGPAGKSVDLWDVNAPPNKDYHTFANDNNIALIQSKIKIRPKEALTVLDFAYPSLGISASLVFLFLLMNKYWRGRVPVNATPVKIVLASYLVLAFALILVRSSVTGLSWDLYLYPLSSFPKVLWTGFYDVLYVLIIACFFLLLLTIFRKQRKISLFLSWLFVLISCLSLIAGILNIRVIEMIGKPFNYPWFYYSDFLKSADAQTAATSNISPEYILRILMVCAAAFFIGLFIILISGLLLQKKKMKFILSSVLIAGSMLYLVIAQKAIVGNEWDHSKLSNPMVAFVASLPSFSGDPELFTMNVDDSLKSDFHIKKHVRRSFGKIPALKNVLVFVMESTPAEYVQPYASHYFVTPELEKHLSESIVFDNIYAHAPSTNNSLVSILGSVYPWLSYNSITKEHPDIKISTVTSELKNYGYRTAFFNSADNRFQTADQFLANRKIDEIKDCNSLQCNEHFEVKDEKWSFMDGKDDECTGDELIKWIRQDGTKPFFAMMWTFQTHYPYFSAEEKVYTTSDPVLNRYLNAVHHSDFVLGKMLRELKQSGLSESTLVVVVGDHGEAFGRHGQITHASGVYEENLHVPCIFINPAFKGEHKQGIGGLVDIAPTIMTKLGYSSAEQWQGKDLFAAGINDRVYFFTPWADYLFGYREGAKKYIFNATKNLTEMYDLEKDPQEKHNIAYQFPEEASFSRQRLAGWVQSMNKRMDAIIVKKK